MRPLLLSSPGPADYHPLRWNFPEPSIPHSSTTTWSYNPRDALLQLWFGLFPGRSPLLGESFNYFLLLEVLRCFSSLRSPPYINVRMTVLQTAGLSHSDTAGSRDICSSPALFAAYRVLHRLREPRHPPCALSYFRHAGKTSKTSLPKLILSAVCVKSSARSPQHKNNRGGSDRPQRRKGRRPSQSCLCQNVKDRCPPLDFES